MRTTITDQTGRDWNFKITYNPEGNWSVYSIEEKWTHVVESVNFPTAGNIAAAAVYIHEGSV